MRESSHNDGNNTGVYQGLSNTLDTGSFVLDIMASTYALPVSPVPHSPHSHFRQHSHGGHSHSHSHSHNRSSSPSKLAPAGARTAYTPRAVQNGSMHSHSQSAHIQGYGHLLHDTHNQKVSSIHEDPDAPLHASRNSMSGKMESSAYSNGHSPAPLYTEFTGVAASQPVDDHSHHGHSHDGHPHDDHCDHAHHAKTVEPRSRITTLLLKHTLNFPLLQSILVEKDSRRIFYFMW